MQKTGTTVAVDSKSEEQRETFKQMDGWLVIANHQSGNFSDILPIFAFLGEDQVKKMMLYVIGRTEWMYGDLFPNNVCKSATMESRDDLPILLKNIETWVEHINNSGNVFLIPSWSVLWGSIPFGAVFHRVVENLDPGTAILVNHIEWNQDTWYLSIAKNIITKKGPSLSVKAHLTLAGDWVWMSGEQARKYYNDLMWR